MPETVTKVTGRWLLTAGRKEPILHMHSYTSVMILTTEPGANPENLPEKKKRQPVEGLLVVAGPRKTEKRDHRWDVLSAASHTN